MLFLYNLALSIYTGLIRFAAWTGKEKARLWLQGRKDWKKRIAEFRKSNRGELVWFHCSSLGEFEQGRPVMERIKREHPHKLLLLTFFSPSGFEIRKNYPGADLVMYLPVDTARNAEDFISTVQPETVFFIKYEYWYHYLSAISRKNIPLFFLSCNFREDHIFFKSYGSFFRKMLSFPTLLMVQNERSAHLLLKAGIKKVKITGDTRFDRVKEITSHPADLPYVSDFRNGHFTLIGGSSWPEDEDLLLSVFITLPSSSKLILVPHDISKEHVSSLVKKAKNTVGEKDVSLFSSMKTDSRILIVDSIGLLSGMYRYADIAWIGGGFGAGIHNTLEAAAYGIPVLFGPNHSKFNEAKGLIECGAGFSVENTEKAIELIKKMAADESFRRVAGKAANEYISSHTGATDLIMETLVPYLNKKSAE